MPSFALFQLSIQDRQAKSKINAVELGQSTRQRIAARVKEERSREASTREWGREEVGRRSEKAGAITAARV